MCLTFVTVRRRISVANQNFSTEKVLALFNFTFRYKNSCPSPTPVKLTDIAKLGLTHHRSDTLRSRLLSNRIEGFEDITLANEMMWCHVGCVVL